MIDTDKYKGHDNWEGTKVNMANEANKLLIADAPLLLAEVKQLRDELNRQMEYIEWLEKFAPKAGEYNTSWDAYELAMGIHWTQMEDDEQ
jgi:hypothetical protein